jgi:hypothetical protein
MSPVQCLLPVPLLCAPSLYVHFGLNCQKGYTIDGLAPHVMDMIIGQRLVQIPISVSPTAHHGHARVAVPYPTGSNFGLRDYSE